MPLRVVQWGSGYTGVSALRYVLRSPALELVGLRCFTESKVGTDAGEVAGLAPTGILATTDVDELLALEADCVLYMPADPEFGDITKPGTRARELLEAVVPILERGTNVVSILTSQIGPQFLGPEGEACVALLERACRAGGSTFFATGFEPGFMADVLPLCIGSSCAEIRSIRAYEILDYSDYDALESLQSVGLCVRPEALAGQSPNALLQIWGSVPWYVARGIGATLDEVRLRVDFRTAPETFTTHRGITVEEGMLAALRFSVEGMVEGEPVIAVEHVNRMRGDLAPEWPNLEPGGGYRIEIEGSNPVRADFHLSLPGGSGHSFGDAMASTAARAVNSVATVCEAAPGVKTFFDLPMVTPVSAFRPPTWWSTAS